MDVIAGRTVLNKKANGIMRITTGQVLDKLPEVAER